jgi:hypothetical protein
VRVFWSLLGFCLPLVALVLLSGSALADELGAAPAWALAGALAAHVATVALRAEAWRLAVNSIAGGRIPRPRMHAACAAGLGAGVVQAAAAAPARAFALRRLAPMSSPSFTQTLVAEGPVIAGEALLATLLLTAAALTMPALEAVPTWAALAGLGISTAALVAMRASFARFAGRRLAAGLSVLADQRRRFAFASLIAALTAFGMLRAWFLLAGFALPHDPASVAVIFATLGIFGTLPLGPAATAGAMVAVFGTVDAAAAAAAGLALAATSALAVALYGSVALAWLGLERGHGGLAAETRSAPV